MSQYFIFYHITNFGLNHKPVLVDFEVSYVFAPLRHVRPKKDLFRCKQTQNTSILSENSAAIQLVDHTSSVFIHCENQK